MSKLSVKIVTPEGLFYQGEGFMVVAPASDGFVGFLPGHQASVIQLGTGDLVVSDTDKSDDKSARKYSVSGGYVQIFNDEVIVLCEEVKS